MLSQEHLTLRLVRLKPSEKWTHGANGLSFVFPNGGGGKYVSADVNKRLAPGDVLGSERDTEWRRQTLCR